MTEIRDRGMSLSKREWLMVNLALKTLGNKLAAEALAGDCPEKAKIAHEAWNLADGIAFTEASRDRSEADDLDSYNSI